MSVLLWQGCAVRRAQWVGRWGQGVLQAQLAWKGVGVAGAWSFKHGQIPFIKEYSLGLWLPCLLSPDPSCIPAPPACCRDGGGSVGDQPGSWLPGDSCLSNPILSISMCSGLLLRRLRVSPFAPAELSVGRGEGEGSRVGWRVGDV